MFRSRRPDLKACLMACAMTVACSGDGEASTVAEADASGSNEVATTTEDAAGSESASNSSEVGGFSSSVDFPSCGEPCDIFGTPTCPEDQKCAAVACEIGSSSWDSYVCVPIMGAQQLGDSCTDFGDAVDGLDDCDEGLMCWDADPETDLGTCIPNCSGPALAPSCPADYACVIPGNGVPAICLPTCDPLAQDCDGGDTCLPNNPDDFLCATDASGDSGAYGSPCEYANACDPGLLCLDTSAVPEPSCDGAAGCCSPYCDLSSPNMCPGAGQVCERIHDPPTAGHENVGVCRVPSP